MRKKKLWIVFLTVVLMVFSFSIVEASTTRTKTSTINVYDDCTAFIPPSDQNNLNVVLPIAKLLGRPARGGCTGWMGSISLTSTHYWSNGKTKVTSASANYSKRQGAVWSNKSSYIRYGYLTAQDFAKAKGRICFFGICYNPYVQNISYGHSPGYIKVLKGK